MYAISGHTGQHYNSTRLFINISYCTQYDRKILARFPYLKTLLWWQFFTSNPWSVVYNVSTVHDEIFKYEIVLLIHRYSVLCVITLPEVRRNTVETLYSTIYYSKYFIELNFDKSTQYVALWTHKRHPIPRPFGRAMECLLWVLQQKLTVS